MRIELQSKKAKLKTAGKFVEEDIEVAAKLQSKSVTPTESPQTVNTDSGFSGIDKVEVGAIPSNYVGSAIARKGETTYTPTTTDQEIASGQYLSGKQVIKGDANLTAENIAKGKTIFGVTGTHEGGETTISGNLTYYNAEIVTENGYNVLKLTSSTTSGENVYAAGQVENNETLYLVRS